MFGIKRLYWFILKTFFPLLLATFSVSLFILLMQFLFMHINTMVGKGVSIAVLGQLFFYASLSFVPMALPLSVLLASLMTFGNLGERLELLAMKASGISLIRIMKPLIWVMVILMGVSFVFQNNVLPMAQTKMYTILISLNQKSPELEIPEGSFYKDIPGYNVYVKEKDKKTGLLKNMMIYDFSKGFENTIVIAADSGRLNYSEEKRDLILSLYDGESFQNMGTRKRKAVNESIPYQREIFKFRSILIPYDANFNMADESMMGNRNIGKNTIQLVHYIDSVQYELDSVAKRAAPGFISRAYASSMKPQTSTRNPTFHEENKHLADSLFAEGFYVYRAKQTEDESLHSFETARNKIATLRGEYSINMFPQADAQKQVRLHQIELQKKFTFSLACLLFFFIGAPLGAIVRKGGVGMPVVLSVIIFIAYYMIDTLGMKMARSGAWTIGEGMWLSSAILLVLGTFFTYKAINDSVIMSPDAWKIYLQHFVNKLKRKKESLQNT